MVDYAHTYTKDHVNDAENNGQFHFVRIQEDDFV